MLFGKIALINQSMATNDSNRDEEKDVVIIVEFNWKNLRTDDFLINKTRVSASFRYQDKERGDLDYALKVTVNRLAQKVTSNLF